MEATFKIPVNALPNIVKSIKTLFDTSKMIEITVKESKQENIIDYAEMFKKTEQLRLKNEKIIVPTDLDLSAIANEVNL
jgi:hypothetical protein